MQPLGKTGMFGSVFKFSDDVTDPGCSSGNVTIDSIPELREPELHIVEIRDRFIKHLGYVRQHILKLTEGGPCPVSVIRSHCLACESVVDKHHHTPVVLSIEVVGLTCVLSVKKSEASAVGIFHPLGFKAASDMTSDNFNVSLQLVNILNM